MAAPIDIIILPLLKDNYGYLLHDRNSGKNAVIDPTVAGAVIDFLDGRGWTLDYILNTHHHWDHVGGNIELAEKYKCAVIANSADAHRIPAVTQIWDVETDYSLLGAVWRVMDTPGHTIGHVAFYLPELSALFCGDTVFGLGCGGLFEGSSAQLWQSIRRIRDLPDDTNIYCGHEYTLSMSRFAKRFDSENAELAEYIESVKRRRNENLPTVPLHLGLQKRINPFLQADSPRIQRIMEMPGADGAAVFDRLYHIAD